MNPEVKPKILASSSALRALSWVLRLAIALQCAAMAWVIHSEGSDVNLLLFGYWNLAENTVIAIDLYAKWALVAATVLVIVYPCWLFLLPVALWAGAEAAVKLGVWYTEELGWAESTPAWIAFAARGARYLTPIALILLWSLLPRQKELSTARVNLGVLLLRVGIAATFVGHGLKAIALDPTMAQLIHSAGTRLLDTTFATEHIEWALTIIGGLDLTLAALIVFTRWRWVAMYMAFWAVVVSLARVVHAWNLEAWYEVLIRATYYGAPFGLYVYWTKLRPVPTLAPEAAAEGEQSLADAALAARPAPIAATPAGEGFFVRMLWRLAAVNLLVLVVACVVWLLGENGYASLQKVVARTAKLQAPTVTGTYDLPDGPSGDIKTLPRDKPHLGRPMPTNDGDTVPPAPAETAGAAEPAPAPREAVRLRAPKRKAGFGAPAVKKTPTYAPVRPPSDSGGGTFFGIPTNGPGSSSASNDTPPAPAAPAPTSPAATAPQSNGGGTFFGIPTNGDGATGSGTDAAQNDAPPSPGADEVKDWQKRFNAASAQARAGRHDKALEILETLKKDMKDRPHKLRESIRKLEANIEKQQAAKAP